MAEMSAHRRYTHLDHFLCILFVVQTVSENITERLKTSLSGVGDCFFLCLDLSATDCCLCERRADLVESTTLALDVLPLSTPYVLVVASIL